MPEARLRIEFARCMPANDYRIRDGLVEVRLIEPDAHHVSTWRRLDENDFRLHRALRTVVAEWIEKRQDNQQSH